MLGHLFDRDRGFAGIFGFGSLQIEQIQSSTRNLQEGDVILALVIKGGITELTTVAQFNQLLAKIEPGSNVTLQIRRGENMAFLSARVNE